MQPVIVRRVEIGSGIPKICIPIVGEIRNEILSQVVESLHQKPDLIEWRADWFHHVFDIEKVIAIARELREMLSHIPLLFTFRTLEEGGNRSIDNTEYEALNMAVARSGYIDLIDIEAFSGERKSKDIINQIKATNVKVIASNHDFEKTPKKQEMIQKLKVMQTLDADIIKLAVMPNNKQDVLTLLSATEEMVRVYGKQPIVTMSMSDIGILSRISGEIYGSAITFGCVKMASASGQLPVDKLRKVLNIIHENLDL